MAKRPAPWYVFVMQRIYFKITRSYVQSLQEKANSFRHRLAIFMKACGRTASKMGKAYSSSPQVTILLGSGDWVPLMGRCSIILPRDHRGSTLNIRHIRFLFTKAIHTKNTSSILMHTVFILLHELRASRHARR